MFDDDGEETKEERAKFKSKGVTLLSCVPGNYDHEDGEDATIITFIGNNSGDVEPLVIDLDDTRKLAVRLLVSLYTSDDEFAERVLSEMFPHDRKGRYHWPRGDDEHDGTQA